MLSNKQKCKLKQTEHTVQKNVRTNGVHQTFPHRSLINHIHLHPVLTVSLSTVYGFHETDFVLIIYVTLEIKSL